MANGEDVDLSFIHNINLKLIFYRSKYTNIKRLYILQSLIKDVLNIIYNNNHLDFKRTFDIIFKL